MPIPDATSLGWFHETAFPALSSTEQVLASALANIASGDDMTPIDLMNYQDLIARRSVIVTTFSSIIKELADTLKGVASKFN